MKREDYLAAAKRHRRALAQLALWRRWSTPLGIAVVLAAVAAYALVPPPRGPLWAVFLVALVAYWAALAVPVGRVNRTRVKCPKCGTDLTTEAAEESLAAEGKCPACGKKVVETA